jgi:hypothetical protein
MAMRALAVAVALVLFGATTAAAQPGEPRAELTPEVRVAGGPHGPHLVDVKGRPLYRFEADQRAEVTKSGMPAASGP